MWLRADYARRLKIRQALIVELYIDSAVLLHIGTFVYKYGQTGSYFACKAPSLKEYFSSNYFYIWFSKF